MFFVKFLLKLFVEKYYNEEYSLNHNLQSMNKLEYVNIPHRIY